MNKYLKAFFHRGLMFGGFGPIVMGVIYTIIERTVPEFILGGTQMLIAVLSTYMIAFVQAGASVFNQIERWSVAKSLFCHFGLIYLVYLLSYIVNTWIPFEMIAVGIFTAIFVCVYIVVWLTIYLIVKANEKKLNKTI